MLAVTSSCLIASFMTPSHISSIYCQSKKKKKEGREEWKEKEEKIKVERRRRSEDKRIH